MKMIRSLFSRRSPSLATQIERDRLSRTMPGQTGAVAAARLGGMIG